MANFVSNDNATSLMNAINQKKDSKPSTITWAEWIALTDEQREGTHYIITNVPAKFSDKDAVFSIKDQTLAFTNKTATVTDSRITTDTYILTFYHNQAVAQAAGIECSWTTGTVTFTVDDDPSESIVVDILCILPALATPPSEGGGHSIIDSSGNTMPKESAMQFADSHISDDPTNGRTIVENIKEHTTASDYENATEDGFHVIDDGNDVPIGASSEDKVEVTGDGVKTYSQVLDELFALIDVDKLTANAYLEIGEYFIPVVYKSYNLIRAIGCMLADTGNTFINGYYITASGSGLYSWTLKTTGNTVVNNSSTVAPNGTKITLYYGNKKAVVDLQTTANRCLMGDGETTVEDAIDGTISQLSVNTSYVTLKGLYNGYARSGYLHNITGYIEIANTIPNATTIINPPPEKYMPSSIMGLYLQALDGTIYSCGWSKTLGLYCDLPIPSGTKFRLNFTWYKKY